MFRVLVSDEKFGPQFINPGLERKELCYMEESFDGLVMFVGVATRLPCQRPIFPELKPDSIYFSCGDDDDIDIFDYENKAISPRYYPSEVQRVTLLHLSGLLL